MSNPLTHFNEEGRARMVDVGDKNITGRKAIATGVIYRGQFDGVDVFENAHQAKGVHYILSPLREKSPIYFLLFQLSKLKRKTISYEN